MPRGRRSKDLIHQQNMSTPSNSRGRRSTKNHTKKRIKQESDNREKIKLITYLIEENEELMENEKVSMKERDELSKLKRTHKLTSKALKEWAKSSIRFDVLLKEIEKLGGIDNKDDMAALVDLMTYIDVPEYGEKDKYEAGVNSSYEPPGPSYEMDVFVEINRLALRRRSYRGGDAAHEFQRPRAWRTLANWSMFTNNTIDN